MKKAVKLPHHLYAIRRIGKLAEDCKLAENNRRMITICSLITELMRGLQESIVPELALHNVDMELRKIRRNINIPRITQGPLSETEIAKIGYTPGNPVLDFISAGGNLCTKEGNKFLEEHSLEEINEAFVKSSLAHNQIAKVRENTLNIELKAKIMHAMCLHLEVEEDNPKHD
ncbi:hypothetical protein C0584_04935 [Candidatus Parcubacteria bacterium]|nr:MAG: hypothetical protein C0584_04935 [Candidatus Parcubacteria bacterium]